MDEGLCIKDRVPGHMGGHSMFEFVVGSSSKPLQSIKLGHKEGGTCRTEVLYRTYDLLVAAETPARRMCHQRDSASITVVVCKQVGCIVCPPDTVAVLDLCLGSLLDRFRQGQDIVRSDHLELERSQKDKSGQRAENALCLLEQLHFHLKTAVIVDIESRPHDDIAILFIDLYTH